MNQCHIPYYLNEVDIHKMMKFVSCIFCDPPRFHQLLDCSLEPGKLPWPGTTVKAWTRNPPLLLNSFINQDQYSPDFSYKKTPTSKDGVLERKPSDHGYSHRSYCRYFFSFQIPDIKDIAVSQIKILPVLIIIRWKPEKSKNLKFIIPKNLWSYIWQQRYHLSEDYTQSANFVEALPQL